MLLLRASLSGDAFIRSLSPAAWFRAGVGQTVTGSGVSTWADQSGNGRDLLQGTDSARPALQADGSVLFNGTAHFMKCSAFTLNQPTTVIAAIKQVSWTGGDTFFDGNTALTGMVYQITATPQVDLYAGSSVASNTNLVIGSAGIVSATFNGANSSLRINNTTPTTGNAGASNMGGFTLAARATPSNHANIQVYEVIILPFAPSTAQLDRIIGYEMSRYSVS